MDAAAAPAWAKPEPASVLPGGRRRGRRRAGEEEAAGGGRRLGPGDVGADGRGARLRLPVWRVAARRAHPGPRRSFFACAAVGGAVYVAGGHDAEKNALRSALAYDPGADAWAGLPDMAEERDEPRGLCVAGRFVVVGGYPTRAQGRFVASAESFDPAAASSAWAPVHDRLLPEDGACPRTCCAAPRSVGRMYMLRDGHLVARDGAAAWRPVARVPDDALTAPAVSAFPDGRVVVVGSGCHGGDQTVYVLREEGGRPASWSRAPPPPPEFAGHVQASCFLEL